jgi:hypothetical protein
MRVDEGPFLADRRRAPRLCLLLTFTVACDRQLSGNAYPASASELPAPNDQSDGAAM